MGWYYSNNVRYVDQTGEATMKKPFIDIIAFASILTLAAMACVLPNVATATQAARATIGGTISGDTNGNGAADSGEGPLDNVIVSLSGCGESKTALTGADGSFIFTGLPAGICVLEVTKGGWTYSGSFPIPGYPIPVSADPGHPVALLIYMRPADLAQPTAVPAGPTATPALTDITPTHLPLTLTPEPTSTPSAPMVAAFDKGVNCRAGPGLEYEATDVLLAGQSVPIVGRTEDSSWWQVNGPNYGGGKCFVAAGATQTSGDLKGIPVVQAPIQSGIPIIQSVVIRKDRSSGNLVIYQDIHFSDGEGDVNLAHWDIVSSTFPGLATRDGTVTRSSAEQKAGTIHTGIWNCEGKKYTVVLSVTLVDKAGHRSEPYQYTLVCD
jgi:uncharacterized protein YraI